MLPIFIDKLLSYSFLPLFYNFLYYLYLKKVLNTKSQYKITHAIMISGYYSISLKGIFIKYQTIFASIVFLFSLPKISISSSVNSVSSVFYRIQIMLYSVHIFDIIVHSTKFFLAFSFKAWFPFLNYLMYVLRFKPCLVVILSFLYHLHLIYNL